MTGSISRSDSNQIAAIDEALFKNALVALKNIEDAIFTCTGAAVLSGDGGKPGDRIAIYSILCETGNHVAWVRAELEKVRAARSEKKERPGGWQPMLTAPLDGTEIEILFRHATYWTALKVDGKAEAERRWQAVQRAKWIDHNGGGWTWRGMAGSPVAWRPIAPTAGTTANG